MCLCTDLAGAQVEVFHQLESQHSGEEDGVQRDLVGQVTINVRLLDKSNVSVIRRPSLDHHGCMKWGFITKKRLFKKIKTPLAHGFVN